MDDIWPTSYPIQAVKIYDGDIFSASANSGSEVCPHVLDSLSDPAHPLSIPRFRDVDSYDRNGGMGQRLLRSDDQYFGVGSRERGKELGKEERSAFLRAELNERARPKEPPRLWWDNRDEE